MDRLKHVLGMTSDDLLLLEERERERAAWQEAELTRNEGWGPTYAAMLTTKEDGSIGVFARIECFAGRPVVEVPLRSEISSASLARELGAEAMPYGESDEQLIQLLARERVMRCVEARMNQQLADVEEYKISKWFGNTFGISDHRRHGGVYLKSHDDDPVVKIGTHASEWVVEENVEDFARKFNESLPHLELIPLPRFDYLCAAEWVLPQKMD